MGFNKCFVSLIFSTLFFTNYLYTEPSNEGVYFCTRDLGTSSSKSRSDIEEENMVSTSYIKVIPSIENGQNKILRHCFMMRADKMISKDEHDHLIVQATIGFFYNEDKNEAVYMQEHLTKQAVVSCTLVSAFNDDLDLTWSHILKFYKSSVQKGYDPYGHNCCTVAYDSISAISGDNRAIDPRSFNFGIGTRWKFEGSENPYSSLKLIGIVSDQMFYMLESASPSILNHKVDKKKDEL